MENKEILTVNDLMVMEMEQDDHILEASSLCTVCSWTSSTKAAE